MDANMLALLGSFDFSKLLHLQKEDDTEATKQNQQSPVQMETVSTPVPAPVVPAPVVGVGDETGMDSLASIAQLAMLFM